MFNIFGALSGISGMEGNYEARKVDRYESDGLIISTAEVTDSDKPFETAISHPEYNNGSWIVVEMYDTRELAAEGHKKWVKTMTAEELPESLQEVGENEVSFLLDEARGTDWRKKTKKTKKKTKKPSKK